MTVSFRRGKWRSIVVFLMLFIFQSINITSHVPPHKRIGNVLLARYYKPFLSSLPKSSFCFFSRPYYKYIFCGFNALYWLFCMFLWCFYCFSQPIVLQSNMYSDSTHITHSSPNVDLAVFSFLHMSSGQAKKKSLLLNLSHYRLLV